MLQQESILPASTPPGRSPFPEDNTAMLATFESSESPESSLLPRRRRRIRKLPFSPNVIMKWCTLTLLFSFALLPCGDAGLESAALEVAAVAVSSLADLFPPPSAATTQEQLLFWSNYEFSVDAATAFMGPLDDLLRSGNNNNNIGTEETQVASYLVREEERPESAESCPAIFNQSFRGGAQQTQRTQRVVSNKDKMVFSLFQKGDGSEIDPDGIPTRYMAMQNYKRGAAKQALEATLQWRQQNDIDNILKKPHPKYDICKRVFPHSFVGRDHNGHVIFLQRPALIDLAAGKRNKLTNEDLLMHYIYVNEYLWQILEHDKPLQTMTSVMDLTGLNFNMLKKTELVAFLKVFVTTMDSHYPQRAHKTLILNAPKWFNVLYKVVTPVLRESTKSRIEIYAKSRKQDDALKKYLGKNAKQMVPSSFWSKKEIMLEKEKNREFKEIDGIPNSAMEEGLRDYTMAQLKEAGKKMLPVT